MLIIIFLVLGLIVGSFLNVVVYRLNVAESFLWERSKCPHCKAQIKWYDNIPVISFVLLKFRCRDCKEKISFQYPLVEIFTGILFAYIGGKFFNPADTATWATAIYYLGIASFLVVIFVYDLLYLEIPGLVLWPAVGWVVAFSLFFDLFSSAKIDNNVFSLSIYSGTFAAFWAFLIFFLLVAISKEKWMGIGDAYMVILLGLILGWPKIILALMLAFAFGAIIGLVLIALKKKKMQSQVPFAPFLIAGTLVAMFFYAPIVNWYFGLLY